MSTLVHNTPALRVKKIAMSMCEKKIAMSMCVKKICVCTQVKIVAHFVGDIPMSVHHLSGTVNNQSKSDSLNSSDVI